MDFISSKEKLELQCPNVINIDYIYILKNINLREFDHIDNFSLLNAKIKEKLLGENIFCLKLASMREECELIFSIRGEKLSLGALVLYIIKNNFYRDRKFMTQIPNLIYYKIVESGKNIYLGHYHEFANDFKDRFYRNDYYAIKTRDDYKINSQALTILNNNKYHLKKEIGYKKTKDYIEKEINKLEGYSDRNNYLIQENKYQINKILAKNYRGIYSLDKIDHGFMVFKRDEKKKNIRNYRSVYRFVIRGLDKILIVYIDLEAYINKENLAYRIRDKDIYDGYKNLTDIDFSKYLY